MLWTNPFILAPLAGVSDKTFRKICFEHGCGMAFTEMVSAKGLFYKNENTKDLLAIDKSEGPVGIQLFGHEPEMFTYAVKSIEGLDNACIDINMGCPVPKVVKNHEGSALLNDPDTAAACVKACVESTKKPVTVKMRIGFNETSGVVDFAKRIQDAGATFITVHGRTREQYYSGKADWKVIKEIKSALSIPVVGNGDIFSREDAERMLSETGVDAVMIARGAMGNPWIFSGEIPALEEIKAVMTRHAVDIVAEKGEYAGIRQMRAHAGNYIKGIKGAASLRARINSCESLEQLLSIIKEI
ncbi:MAG: tRNA dihydrouridine synthase DusB [Bacillota bacterium]|nr:tRNA dihydrouridine synthase DusB [Bacillota bacterium]